MIAAAVVVEPTGPSTVLSFNAETLFRVQFHGRLCSPEWTQRGPAAAYLSALIKGTRRPEFACPEPKQ